jgi:hypothetical protein
VDGGALPPSWPRHFIIKSKEKDMKLEGWKAKVVLTAAIIIILNVAITIPTIIALAFVH